MTRPKINHMKKYMLIAVTAFSILYSCSPKSYCFFNTKERLFYISDKKDDSIKTIYVSDLTQPSSLMRVINLNPVSKSFTIVGDSILNQSVFITLTTDKQNRYSLNLKEEDWLKDTVFKCRYLIR